jgi:hypothetical protein
LPQHVCGGRSMEQEKDTEICPGRKAGKGNNTHARARCPANKPRSTQSTAEATKAWGMEVVSSQACSAASPIPWTQGIKHRTEDESESCIQSGPRPPSPDADKHIVEGTLCIATHLIAIRFQSCRCICICTLQRIVIRTSLLCGSFSDKDHSDAASAGSS